MSYCVIKIVAENGTKKVACQNGPIHLLTFDGSVANNIHRSTPFITNYGQYLRLRALIKVHSKRSAYTDNHLIVSKYYMNKFEVF